MEMRRVSGAKTVEDFAAVFQETAADWVADHGICEAWLTGAVTSNIGWVTTGYAPAPAALDDLTQEQLTLPSGVTCHFLSGTSVEAGPHGYFDTVRSEDVQAFGWAELTDAQDGVLCLPGTHTKWVTLKDGAITDILTGVTGESFAALADHTLLARGHTNPTHESRHFDRGVMAMARTLRPALTQMLMSVRTLQLSGELPTPRSADYLSGLLTGEDCIAALDLLPDTTIHIIGDGHAADRYARALSRLGRAHTTYDGQACAVAGLLAIRDRSRARS